MNSLTKVLSDLSSELGVELISEKNLADENNPYIIRFAGLDSSKSFSLVLSRSWKTTQIRFEADAFAGDVTQYLCEQINANRMQFQAIIESNKTSFSSISLEIDGRPFFGNSSELSQSPLLTFEVEALTSESSIEYGLLNDQEVALIEFAVALIATALPISSVVFRNPDEVLGYPEGAISHVLVNKYERDPRNRREAISIHGQSCMACGLNFREKYGTLGDDYIIVHHVVPVSQIGSDYVINPSSDLVTLCANCHAMVHRQDPPISVEQLRQILSG